MEKFEVNKQVFLVKLEALKKDFEELTKQVSPVHWRNTGTQFSNIKKMEHDVSNYTEITKKDLEIEWVREALKLEEGHN